MKALALDLKSGRAMEGTFILNLYGVSTGSCLGTTGNPGVEFRIDKKTNCPDSENES
jgi:hypothetical protein